jgi:chemotaxis protein histidine kinase CheA
VKKDIYQEETMEQYENLFKEYFIKNVNMIGDIAKRVKNNTYKEQDIKEIKRIFHNIKSSAAMMNYRNISFLSGIMEKVLDSVLKENKMSSYLERNWKDLLIEVSEVFEKTIEENDNNGTKIAVEIIRKFEKLKEKMG